MVEKGTEGWESREFKIILLDKGLRQGRQIRPGQPSECNCSRTLCKNDLAKMILTPPFKSEGVTRQLLAHILP